MIHHVNWLALAVLSWASLPQARPDNLRGRTPPVSNTCACLPVPEVTTSVSTKTETIHETVYQSASVIRQTVTATVTMTQAPVVVTETVRATMSDDEQVTVTCTEVISQGPDGSATTLTKPPGGDGSSETKTRTSTDGSETQKPHPSDGSEATQAISASATGSRTESGGSKPTYSSGRDDGDNGTGSKPTSVHHCKHWDGTKCVKPTVAPDPTAVTSTAVVTTTVRGTTIESALPTFAVCSVSVALVTVYNTITATVYQIGPSPATSSVHLPRAPTAAAAGQ
ncbi:hypothetical protein LX32DRAFT_76276 [Colletotrichum zoysiae]|uniref:Uncharacterized protein n=1 Tax=Colletotrichum zoysiae TaxID=1216348 RepID=A0AAD9HBR5_9PEZI|nr:hypothetical protein LX32DRAFT_76276 [Colletotrichum zoysiae]